MGVKDGEQLSDRELKFSYWFLTYKKLFRRVTIVILLLLNGFIYFQVVLSLGQYLTYLQQAPNFAKAIIDHSVDWAKVAKQQAPKELAATQTKIVAVSPGVFDVVVWVENPNPEWYARSTTYTVIFAGQKSEPVNTFVLPGEKRLLISRGFHSSDPEAAKKETSRVLLMNTDWQRLDESKQYLLPSFNFQNTTVEDLGELYLKHRVTGTVTNVSLFGFRQIELIALVWNDQELVTLNTVTLQNVAVGESRLFDIRFTQKLSGSLRVEMFVVTDNIDQANLIPT